MIDCKDCGGEGAYLDMVDDGTGWFVYCPECKGNCNSSKGCGATHEDGSPACSWGYYLEVFQCENCNGTGKVVDPNATACETCSGVGTIKVSKDCEVCAGTGEVACDGEFVAGKVVKNADGTGTVTYTCEFCEASYSEPRTHAEVVEALGEAGHIKSGDAIDHQDATCAEEGYDKYVCAVCDEEFTIPVAKLSHSFVNHVCTECGAMAFRLYGTRMGYAYGYNGNPNAGGETYGYTGAAFNGDYVLTMENLGLLDDKFHMFGEFVNNYASTKTWQCVGFVSADSDYNTKDCLKLVYTNSEETHEFQSGTLAEVQAMILGNGGVLYGETPVDTSFIGKSGIVAVWYIHDGELIHNTYDPMTIDPVTAREQPGNSTGVTVECGEVTIDKSGRNVFYDAELVITIGSGVTGTVNVDLTEALGEAMEKIDRMDGNNAVQPGDTMRYHVRVVNNSGNSYTYVNGSGYIGTLNQNADGVILGTGFENYPIPTAAAHQYSAVPRRLLNRPLLELGITTHDMLNDNTVGERLAENGYGEEGMSNEEITRNYLSHYYLDYFNVQREINSQTPAQDFQDLTIPELTILVNGSNPVGVPETCPEAAEGLYYFFYKVFTADGIGIYDHMAENSASIDQKLASSLPTGRFDLNTNIDGIAVANGFQNTQFGFRMHFQLNLTTTPPETPDEPEYPPYYPDRPEEEIPEEETPLTPPEEEIPEEEVPLAPPEEEITDEEIPLVDAPKTGKAARGLIPAAVLALGTAWFICLGKKRKEND